MRTNRLDLQIRRLRRWTLLFFVMGAALLWIALDHWIGFTGGDDGSVVEIPNYTGQTEGALRFADWMEVTSEYRYDDAVPSGQVISQSPASGERRKISRAHPTVPLRLIVSLGAEQVTLPSLVGMDVREAISLLRSGGLSVNVVTQAGDGREGEVLSMTPSPGERLPSGAQVTLTVRTGTPPETVKVPSLIGLTRWEAPVRLWMSHLKVERVEEIDSSEPAGTVVGQSHMPGTEVMAGTRVTVYVSRERLKEE